MVSKKCAFAETLSLWKDSKNQRQHYSRKSTNNLRICMTYIWLGHTLKLINMEKNLIIINVYVEKGKSPKYIYIKKKALHTVFENLVLGQSSNSLLQGTVVDIKNQTLMIQECNSWWQRWNLRLHFNIFHN